MHYAEGYSFGKVSLMSDHNFTITPTPSGGWEWSCHHCESGTGVSPTKKDARQMGDVHFTSSHAAVLMEVDGVGPTLRGWLKKYLHL